MKHNFITILFFTFLNSFGYSQTDTIYTNNDTLLVNVKELTEDIVKYTYPDEDLLNSLYKNQVRKIVFENGRIQLFGNDKTLSQVNSISDNHKVTITTFEGDIKGLHRIGNINASVKGGTVYSSVDKMKDISYKKMQKIASMMGANIVFLTNEHSATGQVGGYFHAGKLTEASFSGYAYTDKLLDYNYFLSKINKENEYKVLETILLSTNKRDFDKQDRKINLKFTEIYNENGVIYLKSYVKKKEIIFQLSRFDDKNFYLFFKNQFSTNILYKLEF